MRSFVKYEILSKAGLREYEAARHDVPAVVVCLPQVRRAPYKITRTPENGIRHAVSADLTDDAAAGADRIARFIAKYRNRGFALLVQSETGLYTAPAVCAAIMNAEEGRSAEILDRPGVMPSMDLYDAVTDAMNRHGRSEEWRPVPELVFMYGFPASGKTTYAKRLVRTDLEKDYAYLAADDVRKELYGSENVFGKPERIYRVLLDRMMELLRSGRNVVYDACNLYASYRADYLRPIAKAGIACYKTCVRMNAVKSTCLKNHAARNRDFDIDGIGHYFDIGEPPDMREGWDCIRDVRDERLETRDLYLAAGVLSERDCAIAREVAERLRALGHAVSCPYEFRPKPCPGMTNDDYMRRVFAHHEERLAAADDVVCLTEGALSARAVDWPAGYAYAMKKRVLTVKLPGIDEMDQALLRCSTVVYDAPEDMYRDLDVRPGKERCAPFDIECVRALWREFQEIPCSFMSHRTEAPFYPKRPGTDEVMKSFPVGTHRDVIRQWFESVFRVSVTRDLM